MLNQKHGTLNGNERNWRRMGLFFCEISFGLKNTKGLKCVRVECVVFLKFIRTTRTKETRPRSFGTAV